MGKLDTPDLCARLNTLKRLCDELETAQNNSPFYNAVVKRIQSEVDALQQTVCDLPTNMKRPNAE